MSSIIIFLQETWLHESQFEIVKKIDHEFLSHNVSGIKNDNIMRRSHGHGGVSMLATAMTVQGQARKSDFLSEWGGVVTNSQLDTPIHHLTPITTILMPPEIQCHDGYLCSIRIAMKYQYTSTFSQYSMVLQLNAFCMISGPYYFSLMCTYH